MCRRCGHEALFIDAVVDHLNRPIDTEVAADQVAEKLAHDDHPVSLLQRQVSEQPQVGPVVQVLQATAARSHEAVADITVCGNDQRQPATLEEDPVARFSVHEVRIPAPGQRQRRRKQRPPGRIGSQSIVRNPAGELFVQHIGAASSGYRREHPHRGPPRSARTRR